MFHYHITTSKKMLGTPQTIQIMASMEQAFRSQEIDGNLWSSNFKPAKSLQFGSNMRKATEYPGIIIPQVSWTGLSHLQMENEFWLLILIPFKICANLCKYQQIPYQTMVFWGVSNTNCEGLNHLPVRGIQAALGSPTCRPLRLIWSGPVSTWESNIIHHSNPHVFHHPPMAMEIPPAK